MWKYNVTLIDPSIYLHVLINKVFYVNSLLGTLEGVLHSRKALQANILVLLVYVFESFAV